MDNKYMSTEYQELFDKHLHHKKKWRLLNLWNNSQGKSVSISFFDLEMTRKRFMIVLLNFGIAYE